MTNIGVFSSTLLTIVLLTAAWGKLRRPEAFRASLHSYRIIPAPAISLLMGLVPTLELMFAALQWVEPLQPLVSIALAAMFVAFTLLLVRSLLRGVAADCGCFGGGSHQKVSWLSVGRNLVLIALALAGAFSQRGLSAGGFPAALSGIGIAALVLVLDQALTLLSARGAHRPW